MNLVICAEHETIVLFNAKIRPHDIKNSEMKQYCENQRADSSLIVILMLKTYWRHHLTLCQKAKRVVSINIMIIRYQHFMKNGGLPLRVTVKTAIERQLIMNSLTLFSAFVEGIAAFVLGHKHLATDFMSL